MGNHYIFYFIAGYSYFLFDLTGSQVLQIQTSELRRHIETAFSKQRGYVDVNQTHVTENYIRDLFNHLHARCPDTVKVEEQWLDVQHRPIQGQQWIDGVCVNIFLVTRGMFWGTSRDKIMLVGAHYDSKPPSKGVVDNGSGMAAMLETARVIVNDKCTRDHTIMFVAFDLEEFGYVGSQKFVDNYLVPEVLQKQNCKFEGAIILDTVMSYNAEPNSQLLPPGSQIAFPELFQAMSKNQFKGNFLAIIGRGSEDDEMINVMEESLKSIIF